MIRIIFQNPPDSPQLTVYSYSTMLDGALSIDSICVYGFSGSGRGWWGWGGGGILLSVYII